MTNKIIIIFFTLFWLSGCGGTDDTDGTDLNEVPDDEISLSFSPLSIDDEVQEGIQLSWDIVVSVTGSTDEQVYVNVIDNYGILSTDDDDFILETLPTGSYRMGLKTSTEVEAGTHTSTIEVQLCKDAFCNNQFSNSPWQIPVTVSVISNTNLTSLSKLPDYDGWQTGNESLNNSRFVPVTLDASEFNSRWLVGSGDAINSTYYDSATQLLAKNNRFTFVGEVDSGGSSDLRNIVAMDEETGQVAWQHELDDDRTSVHSVVNGDNLNVITNYAGYYSYDLVSGVTQSTQNLPANSYLSTNTVSLLDGILYMGGIYDHHNRVFAYNPVTNLAEWSVDSGSYNYGEESTVVANDTYVYFFDNGRGLIKLDRVTGAEISVVADDGNLDQYGSALLSGDHVVVSTPAFAGESNIAVFDGANDVMLWEEQAEFYFSPVINQEEMFVAKKDSIDPQEFLIESRNLLDGSVNWQATITSYSYDKHNMIVTNNLIFMGLEDETIAFDIASQEVVWRYPRGGEIIMSEYGVLYISDPDGIHVSINAINLQ